MIVNDEAREESVRTDFAEQLQQASAEVQTHEVSSPEHIGVMTRPMLQPRHSGSSTPINFENKKNFGAHVFLQRIEVYQQGKGKLGLRNILLCAYDLIT